MPAIKSRGSSKAKRSGRAPSQPPPARKNDRAHRTETIKFLTLDETRRLFDWIIDKRDKAIFLVAYRHGLRASEVGLLRASDLDLKRFKIMLHRLKGSLSGEHPLQPDEARALKAWLKRRGTDSPILFPSRRGLPISRQMLDVLMKEYAELAMIPKEKRHFHVLKRSIATHLLDAGADLRFLQDWLGHANIQNTVIYASLVSHSREKKAREYFMKLPQL
jgi:type 1 fimbriae regulatory protein FimB/type 1 fimbriae regulatory protein FimE